MSSQQVLRWSIPDGAPVDVFCGPGLVLPVAEFDGRVVSFWTVSEHDCMARPQRTFEVYGTSHPIPDGREWRATAPRHDGLVFHVFEVTSGE